MTATITCVVEGQGEVHAVPCLVNRMLKEMRRDRRLSADPKHVLCAKSGDRIAAPFDEARQLGVEWYVRRAARENPAAILVVVDAEERCVERGIDAGTYARELRDRAAPYAGAIPMAVAVPHHEFEAWYLADFHSLRARGHLPLGEQFPRWRDPERISDCKGVLTDILGIRYRETVHQKIFANLVSLPLCAPICRRSPTYQAMYDAVRTLSAPAGPYVVAR
jgi:hypothetical protein